MFYTITQHVSMKNLFTCIIAIVLLSLCVLEKEAKKNALLMDNENLNQSAEPVQEEGKIQNILVESELSDNENIFASDRTKILQPHIIVSGDSLTFL